jgi:hypothetical protein
VSAIVDFAPDVTKPDEKVIYAYDYDDDYSTDSEETTSSPASSSSTTLMTPLDILISTVRPSSPTQYPIHSSSPTIAIPNTAAALLTSSTSPIFWQPCQTKYNDTYVEITLFANEALPLTFPISNFSSWTETWSELSEQYDCPNRTSYRKGLIDTLRGEWVDRLIQQLKVTAMQNTTTMSPHVPTNPTLSPEFTTSSTTKNTLTLSAFELITSDVRPIYWQPCSTWQNMHDILTVICHSKPRQLTFPIKDFPHWNYTVHYWNEYYNCGNQTNNPIVNLTEEFIHFFRSLLMPQSQVSTSKSKPLNISVTNHPLDEFVMKWYNNDVFYSSALHAWLDRNVTSRKAPSSENIFASNLKPILWTPCSMEFNKTSIIVQVYPMNIYYRKIVLSKAHYINWKDDTTQWYINFCQYKPEELQAQRMQMPDHLVTFFTHVVNLGSAAVTYGNYTEPAIDIYDSNYLKTLQPPLPIAIQNIAAPSTDGSPTSKVQEHTSRPTRDLHNMTSMDHLLTTTPPSDEKRHFDGESFEIINKTIVTTETRLITPKNKTEQLEDPQISLCIPQIHNDHTLEIIAYVIVYALLVIMLIATISYIIIGTLEYKRNEPSQTIDICYELICDHIDKVKNPKFLPLLDSLWKNWDQPHSPITRQRVIGISKKYRLYVPKRLQGTYPQAKAIESYYSCETLNISESSRHMLPLSQRSIERCMMNEEDAAYHQYMRRQNLDFYYDEWHSDRYAYDTNMPHKCHPQLIGASAPPEPDDFATDKDYRFHLNLWVHGKHPYVRRPEDCILTGELMKRRRPSSSASSSPQKESSNQHIDSTVAAVHLQSTHQKESQDIIEMVPITSDPSQQTKDPAQYPSYTEVVRNLFDLSTSQREMLNKLSAWYMCQALKKDPNCEPITPVELIDAPPPKLPTVNSKADKTAFFVALKQWLLNAHEVNMQNPDSKNYPVNDFYVQLENNTLSEADIDEEDYRYKFAHCDSDTDSVSVDEYDVLEAQRHFLDTLDEPAKFEYRNESQETITKPTEEDATSVTPSLTWDHFQSEAHTSSANISKNNKTQNCQQQSDSDWDTNEIYPTIHKPCSPDLDQRIEEYLETALAANINMDDGNASDSTTSAEQDAPETDLSMVDQPEYPEGYVHLTRDFSRYHRELRRKRARELSDSDSEPHDGENHYKRKKICCCKKANKPLTYDASEPSIKTAYQLNINLEAQAGVDIPPSRCRITGYNRGYHLHEMENVLFDHEAHGFARDKIPNGKFFLIKLDIAACDMKDCKCSLHKLVPYTHMAVFVPKSGCLCPSVQFLNP